jgi:peptidoglycan/xylan/chitin deacetylase (PgdA/CDA1 family)
VSRGANFSQAVFEHQVPILCYHNIHELHRKSNPYLTVTDSVFSLQLKSLHDSGYHTISPDQLYQYLTTGVALPARSFMISFDDSHAEDYAIAEPILQKFGFEAIFFVTTGYLDRNKHLSITEIKELSDDGNAIAAHTWDHPNLRTSKNFDWRQQLDAPREELEAITGKPVNYFAYPYGSWNHIIIDSVKRHGYKAAFQLNGNLSGTDPLYTIRRITVSDRWSSSKLQLMMKRKFA